MIIRINNAWSLKNVFSEFDRDHYSNEAYEALLNYYDEIDPDMELDVIAICCEWTELNEEDLKSEYGEFMDDPNYSIDDLVEGLERQTTIIKLSNTWLVEIF